MISEKYWGICKINSNLQLERFELLHHHDDSGGETLWECNIECILLNLSLKSSGSSFSLDYCLSLLWHALNQMNPPMIYKVIPNTDNHLLHDLLRYNISIFLRNYILHMCSNVLNGIEIRRTWRVLMVLHFKLL